MKIQLNFRVCRNLLLIILVNVRNVVLDELLDIVDCYDRVIGQKLRSEVYAQRLFNFRVVNAFLINEQGQLWIPRRTKTKCIFPLCLDASMGGHVMAGESYEDALTRELMEELRIDTKVTSYNYKGSLNPYMHSTSAFMRVYVVYTNDVPDYNENDFIEYFWLTSQELLDRVSAGERCKDDLPRIIQHLLL